MVDGMVLDVKRWLPEHPGGDRIIPAQSLNVEAARHFELYHSSKVRRLSLSLCDVRSRLSLPLHCLSFRVSALSLSPYSFSLSLSV